MRSNCSQARQLIESSGEWSALSASMLRRQRLASICIWLVGCSSSPPTPEVPPIPRSEDRASTNPPLPTNDLSATETPVCDPRGATLQQEQREDLLRLRQRHVAAVSWDPSQPGCDWTVLTDCVVDGEYAFLSGSQAENAPAVWKWMWDQADARWASGMWVVSSPVDRAALSQPGCAPATHVIEAMVVGPEDGSKTCPDTYWGPIDGCLRPVRVRLTPIQSVTSSPDEASFSAVRLRNGVRIDRTEVSVDAYQICVEQGRCPLPKVKVPPARELARGCTYGVRGLERHPVNCVSWFAAQSYCRFVGGRLPTSAEWTAAAAGQSARRYVWGMDWPMSRASGNFADERARDAFPYWEAIENYADGFGETAPVDVSVGDRAVTGVVHLAGNVREWVADRKGEFRMVRGASYGESDPDHLRISRAVQYRANVRSAHIGFRCAKTDKAR